MNQMIIVNTILIRIDIELKNLLAILPFLYIFLTSSCGLFSGADDIIFWGKAPSKIDEGHILGQEGERGLSCEKISSRAYISTGLWSGGRVELVRSICYAHAAALRANQLNIIHQLNLLGYREVNKVYENDPIIKELCGKTETAATIFYPFFSYRDIEKQCPYYYDGSLSHYF